MANNVLPRTTGLNANFRVRTFMPILIALTLSVLAHPVEAKRPKAPGERVRSGAFYDFVMDFYTKTLPPLIQSKNAEKFYAAVPIDQAHYKVKDDDGKVWNYESRKAYTKKRWSDSPSEWHISVKVKKVTMTDPTHGAVDYVVINDWKNTFSGVEGRVERRSVSHWENIDGEWRIVYSERGTASRKRYR